MLFLHNFHQITIQVNDCLTAKKGEIIAYEFQHYGLKIVFNKILTTHLYIQIKKMLHLYRQITYIQI